ncbi:MAG TPA: helix-turn-helix transcriptional regulator [Candidatus Onthovivens sp.]|nr:helix-turn-helix transcriptional regulator [Candidatus Onthovivens sp.]
MGDITRIQRQLALRLYNLRKDRLWTLEAAAYECELNRNYYADLEKGIRNPSLEVLLKLAKGFDLSLSELLENLNEKIKD